MPNDPNLNDPRIVWQHQERETAAITVDDVRRRATRLDSRIYWRNMREYAGGAVVIPIFASSLWHLRGWRIAAPLLMIAGIVYVLFQLYRRSSIRPLPEDMGLRTSMDYHLRELERQSDALHTVWLWYLLPFVPGLAVQLLVAAVDRGIDTRLAFTGVMVLVVFVGIWGLNESAARKIDRTIEELREIEVGQ